MNVRIILFVMKFESQANIIMPVMRMRLVTIFKSTAGIFQDAKICVSSANILFIFQ
jgi:hypothetical protein